MYDMLPARSMVPPVDVDILNLQPGMKAQASFKNNTFDVEVIAAGEC